MAYEMGFRRQDLFDREKAKSGEFDSSYSFSKLKQYFTTNNIHPQTNGNLLEITLEGIPVTVSFQPRGFTGEGYVVVKSPSQEKALGMKKLLRGMK